MESSEFPPLNAPVSDAGGAVLTPQILDKFRDYLLSDEYREKRRRAQEEQEKQLAAMNLRLKTEFARSIGKTVEELTKEDMHQLNEELFQAWLQYKGVTEQEFWDWLG